MNKIGYIVITVVGLVFLGRLSYLQLFSGRENILDNSTVEAIKKYPERGYIYDRNGELLVANQLSYDLYLTPSKVKAFDTLELCKLLKITKSKFITIYRDAASMSRLKPSPFITQLSLKEYAYLKEVIYKYDWISVRKHFSRYYNHPTAANVLGYIGEVNNQDLNKSDYYDLGDYLGKQGVEKQYEKELRGVKGVEYIQKDRFNRKIGLFKNGVYDTLPVKGKDIEISIDHKLQAYGEQLMVNKRGGIVAIDPTTGEILALVSSPTYDPSLLVGRDRSENYRRLSNDSLSKPLYDRSLLAMYAPGSTFKSLNGLIALQERVITPNTSVVCNHGVHYGRNAFMKCHCTRGTANNLRAAIYDSCNSYFAMAYLSMINHYANVDVGMDQWNNHVKSFGLGDYLGYDLPNGNPGKVPNSKTYNSKYNNQRWYATYTISNAIGQGEILVTPIQMANVAAIIANRGYYYIPHLIRKIDNKLVSEKKYNTRHYTTIEEQYFNPIVKAMMDVYQRGTASNSKIKDLEIAGKTGTVENYIRVNGNRMKLTDHSTFMAFAPLKNPRIAILVYVENGYWGSRYAAPIASLCIEKYLKGEISRRDMEELMFSKSLEAEYAKPYSGIPFKINDDEW